MNQLIKAILAFLEANEIVRAEDHEVYAYGLDAILYTMISTLGLVLIGVVMRSTTEALVINKSDSRRRIPCLDTFKVFSYNGSWLVMLLEHIVHPISSARKSDNSSNVYGFHAALSPCIAYKQSIPVQ